MHFGKIIISCSLGLRNDRPLPGHTRQVFPCPFDHLVQIIPGHAIPVQEDIEDRVGHQIVKLGLLPSSSHSDLLPCVSLWVEISLASTAVEGQKWGDFVI